MRVLPGFRGAFLCFCVCLFLIAGFCQAEKKTVEVVGSGECADCAQNNFKISRAFSGLKVNIDCKKKDGKFKTRGFGELDKEGKFKVSLPDDLVENGKLKEECYAQLYSVPSKLPCPAHNGLESNKILLISTENGKYVFGLSGNLKFSPITCSSAFFWPYFKHPLLPHHPLFPPKVFPPFPPKVFPPFPPKVYPPFPPKVYPPPKELLPPVPIYNKPPPTPVPVPEKPCPPKEKPKPPPVPVEKPCPPKEKPKPPPVPVIKPPPVPEKKPCPPKPPVYKPPPTPVVPVLPPPIPIYKPLPPLPKIPPFYKKPCPPLPKLPPFPKIPPKIFHHPKFGKWPPLPPLSHHPKFAKWPPLSPYP